MKKFILSLMLLLPLSMAAQDVKIAVVDFNGIVTVMPEVNALESQLMALQQRYQSELQSLENDFNRKQSDYISQQDSLNENIKIMRMQEIEDIRMRMENLYKMAQQEIEKTQADLFAPIQEKIQKAIDQVGDENNYTLVLMMNPNNIAYRGKTATDATDQVKAKLGLK